MKRIDKKRRQLLGHIGGLAGVSILSPASLLAAYNTEAIAADDKRAAPPQRITNGPFDVDFRLRAEPDTVSILPGAPSKVWRYTAALTRGPQDTLTSVSGSYPGPLIRLRRGQRVRARLENRLSEDTTVHWHGLHVPSDVDGQPRLPIKPGEDMTVAFDVVDRAGLYWYHPHPHGPNGGRVGFQSYAGLAGPLIIEDDTERALNLPAGDQELILVLQDRTFAGDNELTFVGGMRSMMRGFFGDRVLVNDYPPTTREVGTRPYRLRILNGSNARIYKLAWSDGRPVTVIGTGGGLLGAPEQRPYVTLTPGQRIDLWVDLSDAKVGDQLTLISDAYNSGMMDGAAALPAGARFELVPLRVTRRTDKGPPLPKALDPNLKTPSTTPATPIRTFDLRMEMMSGFSINGRQFQGAVVADDEIVTLGDTEIWEFVNDSMMPHPMHVHGLQFAVIERRKRGGQRGWTGLDAGLVDAGLLDTVLVLPGERVRIALTFTDFDGLYLYHCHNMEHGDHGMMRYYRVRA
ncbi:MAG: multicopper oxidase family protein [Salinisphaera sp.]|jgi:FtsP/CotA-like multicopper oxidase with cupredoxin domain|nr:multicopper oxidase family protein [Salinisphaera sp.]